MEKKIPSLVEVLSQIADPRKSRGQRHPLMPILLMVCVAMLSGATSQLAIAEWGRNYGPQWAKYLGFTRNDTPSQATLSRLFAKISIFALEQALSQWAELVMTEFAELADEAQIPLELVAIDGKALRGAAKQGSGSSHLLSACSHRLGLVLAQLNVEKKTNEIGVMIEFLAKLMLEGRVFTMDALLTQRNIASTIVAGGGDYIQVVKANQLTLLQNVQGALDKRRRGVEVATVTVQNSGHGRSEKRELSVASLEGKDIWPGATQALRMSRWTKNEKTGRVRKEIAYAVTSVDPNLFTPEDLLHGWRGHWTIENKEHYVRDVTFKEDLSTVRKDSAPQFMAAFRNLAISLLRLAGFKNIASACRLHMAHPARALALLGLVRENE